MNALAQGSFGAGIWVLPPTVYTHFQQEYLAEEKMFFCCFALLKKLKNQS